MARSRGYVSTPRRGQRRKTSWGIGPQTGVDGAAQSITASSATLATGGAFALLDGITVVRMRGDLSLFLTQATALGDGYHGAFGIGITRAPAFTAGIASLPTPLTDEDDENWLYHRYVSLFAGGIIANAAMGSEEAVNPISAAMHFGVDSKAMRKLDVGVGLYAALEVVELGSAGLRWAYNSRVLVKLS